MTADMNCVLLESADDSHSITVLQYLIAKA